MLLVGLELGCVLTDGAFVGAGLGAAVGVLLGAPLG